jgi:hypothetical protein
MLLCPFIHYFYVIYEDVVKISLKFDGVSTKMQYFVKKFACDILLNSVLFFYVAWFSGDLQDMKEPKYDTKEKKNLS